MHGGQSPIIPYAFDQIYWLTPSTAVGSQLTKGRQNAPTNGYIQQSTFYLTSSPADTESMDAGDLSMSRGPILNLIPGVHTQQNVPNSAPRPQLTTTTARSPAGLNGGLERRPSASHAHYRQTSRAQGMFQHSRNTSYVNSPTTSPLSPNPNVSGAGPTAKDRRPSDLSSHTNNSSPNLSSTSTTLTVIEDQDVADASNGMLGAKRADRSQSTKGRRGHGHHRSQSKQQTKTAGEYAFHNLFHSFSTQANYKINQCVVNIPPRIEDVCGLGADPFFDQSITALAYITRRKPSWLIDSIMKWRKRKADAAANIKTELTTSTRADYSNHSRAPSTVPRVTLPRRHTEPLHIASPEPGLLNQGFADSGNSSTTSLQEASTQADHRSLLAIYLLCRVLIEIYKQSHISSITLPMCDKLEDLIMNQLVITEPEQLATSSFRLANCIIYGQLLGVMSEMRFHTVSQRFIQELKTAQINLASKGGGPKDPKEAETKAELMILATRHLRLKTQPESAWNSSCDYLLAMAELFITSHGQDIKHAYCQTLEALVAPISANPTLQFNSPKWKEFSNTVNSRLTQMLVKPRHWAEAFRLSAVLLCASPIEVFSTQWLQVVNLLQAKLKDRATRAVALQSISRLVWTYLDRNAEPMSSTMRKLEDVIKIVLPSGKRSYFSADPIYAEPIVEIIRIIGYRYQDFGFKAIIFALINAELFTPGRDIKVEQLDPERMVLGIRAFLAIMADLEKTEHGRPLFPQYSHDRPITDSTSFPSRLFNSQFSSQRQPLKGKSILTISEETLSRPVDVSGFSDSTREYYTRFCEILGRITLICDNAFGGQAVLDEKFGGLTPKTPISETFSFGRREEHPTVAEHRQGFYELLHVAVQALPRCLSTHISFHPFINLLCTGTAHVQSNIARSSAQSLKAIARQSHAQPVTIGFARFIFNFDVRYATMSDEGLLGPGHIENTLKLYVELLQIWIEEIKQKTKDAANEPAEDGTLGSRGLQLDMINVLGLVDEVESHGIFFLCSQSRRVRSFAVKVLKLVTEFDIALGQDHPRIIRILEGDSQQVMDSDDDQLSVAERSRLQKGKGTTNFRNTLIELCSSDVSYDSTLWFKIFPNLIRLAFGMCPSAVTLGREIVCTRLLQMYDCISNLETNPRGPQIPGVDGNETRLVTRLGQTSPEVIVEQWKLYLVMACTTITNAGAQTRSELANTQHARKISNKGPQGGLDKINSARALFAYVIPLLSATMSSIRDAIVIALGSININLYRTLLESLQYAVTTCKEEAKLRIGTHQRTGSSPARNRRTDRLRTEVTHVYKLTARFLREKAVLEDEWILNNIATYTKDLMIFLSDAEVQTDWECQRLRRQYCGLLEELFEGMNRTKDPSRWMAFESRKSAFALMEDWCGYSPNQSSISQREDSMTQLALLQPQLENGERQNVTAAMEIEKRNLRTAALSAMAALCGGPIRVVNNSGDTLSFDIRRMLSWIDQIFGTASDKMHLIGRRALRSLITHNQDHPYLLEHTVEKCYAVDRPKALESYFHVVTKVLMEHEDYPVAFWRVLGAVLFTLGNEMSSIRTNSVKLLRTLEHRLGRDSKLQDFDISVSDRTTAVYKTAQFEISRRLAKQHTDLAFFIFSQFSVHFKNANPDGQRKMVAAVLPWVQAIELQVTEDPNGGPTPQSYMLLANLLEITTKNSGAMHNEVQALWQALATGPHGGNVQVVLDFVISLCLDRREQNFVDYAKQIIVHISSTPAGQKVVEFLLLQITPRNMVHDKRQSIRPPSENPGLPYVADLGEALPIGNGQSGLSLGQLSLIFLVDLMVAPMSLSPEGVTLLLQVVLVLWDHYNIYVQEQAREMLVHLIHELVISKIDDNSTTPNKSTIEGLVESIRQHEPRVVWTYEECNGKEDEDDARREPGSMVLVTNEVIGLFSIAYPRFQEHWAKTTLNWATSCAVRHIACRSFQIFRCILSSLDQSMLADMLTRLSNTIADENQEVQTFAMESLTTLKTIIGALQPSEMLRYPQIFWATCACLGTIHEREFAETLGMLDNLLQKIDLRDPAVMKLLKGAKPVKWQGEFEGIAPLVYKGLKSSTSMNKTLKILDKIISLPESELVGTRKRLMYAVLGNLPCFLHSFNERSTMPASIQQAKILAAAAKAQGDPDIVLVFGAFVDLRFTTSQDFMLQVLSALKRTFSQVWELDTLVFLIGLTTNKLSWYKLNILEILGAVLADIDTRRPEIVGQGPDLILPLLHLLQTEHCPKALQILDHIVTFTATPNDHDHIRMSIAYSASRSLRKEFEKTKSLYGIPEDSGWSIPMPANHANSTRLNMQAVFFTCANGDNGPGKMVVATPDVEFYAEDEHQNGIYMMRLEPIYNRDHPQPDFTDDGLGDLASKLDILDDFFEDCLNRDGSRPYSSATIRNSDSSGPDDDAENYDEQTAPILQKTLRRTGSVASIPNSFADPRGPQPPARDPGVMTPTAFTTSASTTAPPITIGTHARSITSPTNHFQSPYPGDVISDEDTDETMSDDELTIGHSRGPNGTLRASKSTNARIHGGPGAAGYEYRQRELLRVQSRSRIHDPNSPEVPRVPDVYLGMQPHIRSADL